MDILNAFVANQGKRALIFGKGNSAPPPPTRWGFCLLKTTDGKQILWRPNDQNLHVHNFSVVRSVSFDRSVFPNQKVYKYFFVLVWTLALSVYILTKRDLGMALPWYLPRISSPMNYKMEAQDSTLDDWAMIGTNLWSRLVKDRDNYCDTGQRLTAAPISKLNPKLFVDSVTQTANYFSRNYEDDKQRTKRWRSQHRM